MIKHTPYYHKLAAAGAKFQDRGGFATINFLTSIEDEHRAVRERAGIFDVYYQVAVEVRGPDSAQLLQRALTNDVRRIGDGGVLYSPACNAAGGMLDDLTCFRFSAERFWVCPTPSRVAAIAAHLEEQAAGQRTTVTNLGYANAYLSIQGPRSRDLLATLTDTDLSTAALPYFRFAQGAVAGVPGTVISRTGYSGELGYELFYPVEYAEHLWDAVVAAGAPFDLRICGMKTMRSLRIEKRYLLYGLDVSTDTDPLSAGVGWAVRWDDRDFLGRAALERVAARGVTRTLCLLQADGFHPIVHGEPVLARGEVIGTVTSGDPAPTLGCTLAYAYLPAERSEAGTRVDIRISDRNSAVAAHVVAGVPYDPERRRARI
jgi:aminomethyltransferase